MYENNVACVGTICATSFLFSSPHMHERVSKYN